MTNFEIMRGNTFFRTLYLTLNGEPINIAGWTVYFTVREERDAFEATSETGDSSAVATSVVTTHTDAAAGQTSIGLSANQTNGIVPGTYVYDVQVKRADGTIDTPSWGYFTVKPDVTRAI